MATLENQARALIEALYFRETVDLPRWTSSLMMPTTRSANKQARLDDFTEDKARNEPTTKGPTTKKSSSPSKAQKQDSGPLQRKSNSSAKRKAPTEPGKDSQSPAKKAKGKSTFQQQHNITSNDTSKAEKPIIINRSPVLQLWGAVVATFIYPDLSWPACLSVGNAISALCAVSKGKAIGLIEPKEKSEGEVRDAKKRKKEAEQDSKTVEVMGFSLQLKSGAVLLGGKPKPLDEGNLRAKFGEEEYERVKQVMTAGLREWEGNKDELNRKAFHMYERFRPKVSAGQRGWGRKGELDLEEVKAVVRG